MPTPPSAQALESFTAEAIEIMAGWLGVPAAELTVAEAEAVVWEDTCIGVSMPLPCGEWRWPGFRVVIHDLEGNPHSVHTIHAEHTSILWSGESRTSGEIVRVEGHAITIAPDGGGPELTARVVPGTQVGDLHFQLALDRVVAGQLVWATYDRAPTTGGLPVLAELTILQQRR